MAMIFATAESAFQEVFNYSYFQIMEAELIGLLGLFKQ